MHGLINRSIQCFLRDTYGLAVWNDVAERAGVDPDGFEAMLTYEDGVTGALLDSAALHLARSRDSMLEDLGTYLVSHRNTQGLRRLLRFGGESFVEFLHSLEDLPGRARLAVPDLDLPSLHLSEHGTAAYSLICRWQMAGVGRIAQGVLRAMADDYGALVVLDQDEAHAGEETVSIQLLDASFAEGRSFVLGATTGG